MKKNSQGSRGWAGALAFFAVLAAGHQVHAAVDLTDVAVFKTTTRVGKTYVAKMFFQKDVSMELWTETDTAGGLATDPVMFLIGGALDSNGQPTVRKASDDYWTGDVDAKIAYTSPTGEWMTVVVVAYDSAYVGKTKLRVKIGTTTSLPLDIWAGGTVIETPWGKDDTFTLTGHYQEYSLESMCRDVLGRPGAWLRGSGTTTP